MLAAKTYSVQTQEDVTFNAFIVDGHKRIQEVHGQLWASLHQKPLRKGMRLTKALEQAGCIDADNLLREAILNGKTTTTEFALNDHQHWLKATILPKVKQGFIDGAIITLEDVSAQKREEAYNKISTQMASLSLLAKNISHRLNNPLAAILNQIGSLLMEDLETEDRQRLRRELSSLQEQVYALSLVTNVLDLFARDVAVGSKLVNVNGILEKAIDLVQLLHVRNQIKYRLKLEDHLPPIYGNEIALEQCFLHLFRNAQEAMPNGGLIYVHTRLKPQNHAFIEITIKDNGIGVPPAHLSKVFDPFFTTKGKDHLGLGLCISYSIISSLKGFIELFSRPKTGTTVRLSLPIARTIPTRG